MKYIQIKRPANFWTFERGSGCLTPEGVNDLRQWIYRIFDITFRFIDDIIAIEGAVACCKTT